MSDELVKHRIIDGMAAGVNEMYCTCGARLMPDCDVSAASICEEFERHLCDAHGWTMELINAELALERAAAVDPEKGEPDNARDV